MKNKYLNRIKKLLTKKCHTHQSDNKNNLINKNTNEK